MPPISIMMKPASSLCNMRCDYCFYHDVTERREEASFGIMEQETALNIIKKALAYAGGESISFAFQGGEPLIAGLDFFKFFTKNAKLLNDKKSKIQFSLQTNGTLLDDEWARFFYKENVLIGLSLDGDANANAHRKLSDGNNSHKKILEGAKLLEKHSVEFNILCVLTGECADNIENIYSYFKKNNFRYLQFIPCLRPFGSDCESPLYMTSAQYSRYLTTAFGLYSRDYAAGDYISIRQFDNYVHLYFAGHAEQCGMNGYCSYQYVVEGNGNVYPCDFYCLDKWLLGNINDSNFEAFAKSKKSKAFLAESHSIPENCKNCLYYPLCRAGGCKRNREHADYCKAYKKFFSKALPQFRVFAANNK